MLQSSLEFVLDGFTLTSILCSQLYLQFEALFKQTDFYFLLGHTQ
jgi:hypothetical protein